MARAPDPRIEQAKTMYLEGQKLVEIASQLNLPEGTVRRWKSTHKWDSERSDKNSERSHKRKRGAQPKNQNAIGNSGGAPEQNKNAEKFGFFSKYLPEETVSIIQEMPTDPLDVLWDQIQIAYAAIIRGRCSRHGISRGTSCRRRPGHSRNCVAWLNSMMSCYISAGILPRRNRKPALPRFGRRRTNLKVLTMMRH